MTHPTIEKFRENPGLIFDALEAAAEEYGDLAQVLMRFHDETGENLPTIVVGVEPFDFQEDE